MAAGWCRVCTTGERPGTLRGDSSGNNPSCLAGFDALNPISTETAVQSKKVRRYYGLFQWRWAADKRYS